MCDKKNSLPSKHAAALTLLAVGLLLTVSATVMHCINLYYFYDVEIGYFTSGALLPRITRWLVILSTVSFAAMGIFVFRGSPLRYAKEIPLPVRLGAIVSALGVIALTALDILSYVKGNTEKLPLHLVLLGILSVVFFVLLTLNKRMEALQVISGFAVILRLVLLLADSYFNILVPMNAPEKISFMFGCLGGMVLISTELRGVARRIRPGLALFLLSSATLLLGFSSIPWLFGYVCGIHTDPTLLGGSILLLSLFAVALCRFITVCLNPFPAEEDEEKEPTGEPSDVAAAETADLSEESPAPESTEEEPTPSDEEEASPSSKEE